MCLRTHALPWKPNDFVGQTMIRREITFSQNIDPDHDEDQLALHFSCSLLTAPDAEHAE